ncbi:MAG TPA: ATP-binding protein [Polyangiaceae bacterium]|nr:ATP-binding protein [Polyangiaceae bacterium]
MSPERGFEEWLADVNLSAARLGYVLAAVLMPGGVALDLFCVPDKVGEFLLIRLGASVIACAAIAASYLPMVGRYPVLLGAGAPLLCAVGIEIMILRLEGGLSPYYAGLNLCTLAMAVLYLWRWQQFLYGSGLIVAIWLFPTLPQLWRGEVEFAPFFNNLYFLTLTSVIAVTAGIIRFRAARREHEARSNLAKTSAELATTLERLQELDRLKNEFFANVSHELRTPLTLILTPVEDLLSRDVTPQLRSALSVIRRNAHRLLRLIDDLLDLARLDVGGLRLHVAEVDLVDLTSRVVEAARGAAEARGMSLEFSSEQASALVHGDPHRLEIVLTNLLGNALKFTPDSGKVAVRVIASASGFSVEVEDTGPGIEAPELERIFDRFYQVEGSERRRQGGAGIGLSLAKKLAELHGGNVSVESQVGVGSTFTLSLPEGRGHFRDAVLERRRVKLEQHPRRRADDRVAPAASPELSVLSEVAPPDSEVVRMDRGRRPLVLVAEDEPDLREYIRSTLSPLFDLETAADGAEALTKVRARAPDLVLTDVMMPGTSGTDLCRAIKQDPRLRSTPVIVLTALSSTDNVLEAYSAGADDFVTKPFHSRVLLARINAQLRLRSVGLQLADQARLATAGTLAGGVAHEVRNPLNAVLNAARTLPDAKGRPEAEKKLLGVIVEGALRIDRIVGALEEHVRPAEGNAILQCDVQSGLRSSVQLLEHKMSGIAVHMAYESTRAVVASARELNQVFLNLIDNAVRSGAKNIWLRTADETQRVSVTVSDDGPGVPKEVAVLIFEPFFTTRPVGEGTGLGLYLCRRIVTDCGGTLQYHPREGGGAVFSIGLPAVEVAA